MTASDDALRRVEARVADEMARLRSALEAYRAWSIAEEQSLFTLDDRVSMCSYAEWLTERALDGCNDPFVGPPLGISLDTYDIARHSEEHCAALVREALASARSALEQEE